jgi:hypothetical protein
MSNLSNRPRGLHPSTLEYDSAYETSAGLCSRQSRVRLLDTPVDRLNRERPGSRSPGRLASASRCARRVGVAGDKESEADDEVPLFARPARIGVARRRGAGRGGLAPLGRTDRLVAGRAARASAAPSGNWFQGVVAGKQPKLPGDLAEDQPPYEPLSVLVTTYTPSAEVATFYGNQCAQFEAVLAITPLSAPPLGKHGRYEPPDGRWVVLHKIHETAMPGTGRRKGAPRRHDTARWPLTL